MASPAPGIDLFDHLGPWTEEDLRIRRAELERWLDSREEAA